MGGREMKTKKLAGTMVSDALEETDAGFLTVKDYCLPKDRLGDKEVVRIVEDLLSPVSTEERHRRREE